ncbi:MAG TPA: sulfatase [Planctomycetota bacterium]|nr:sulfatase [Planctomycetota bacterium]
MRPAGLALLAALGALCGCSGDEGAPRVDRVHDLLSRLDRAVVEDPAHGAAPLDTPTGGVDEYDNRDGVGLLRSPPGRAFTFLDLPTSGPAELRFGCGSARPPLRPAAQGGPGEGSSAAEDLEAGLDVGVTFRVEARDRSAGDSSFATVFERTLRGDELPANGAPVDVALPLGSGAPARWDLRFSCSAERPAAWPAWFAPQLVSDGRPLPLEQRPVALRSVALDLLEALGSAEVVQQSAGQPVVRSAFDAAAGVHEAGGVRPVILAAAPSRLRYTVPVAAGSTLEFAIGVHPWKGWKKGGDGLTFAVEIEGQRVWQRRLDPARVFDDRGWTPGRVDLTPWDGQTVALELVTEPGADAAFDLGGWSDIAVVSRASTPRLAAGDAPTLVLVVVDTLRADRLGCYGGAVATPRIDALAARGVRFATARAASSWTWPATSSILTGLYPGAHGVRDYQRCLLVEGLDTLPELCMRRGYTTGGFVANALIAADNNFDQGFETFVCAPNVTARALNARVAAWLADTEGCARFLYVHYMDPHLPYLPPPAFIPPADELPAFSAEDEERLRARLAGDGAGDEDTDLGRRWVELSRRMYDAEVAYLDTALGELLDALDAQGALQDAIVVLTADHGEEFLEHGLIGHGNHLYDESVRVPLVVTAFGRRALDPRAVALPVESKDILPTLAALAGLPAPSYELPGVSLLEARPRPVYSETLTGLERGSETYVGRESMTADRWKLIETEAEGRVELYDLAADPGEQRDVGGSEPERRAAMLAELQRWRKATALRARDNLVLDHDEAEAKLRALGYLGR